MGGSAQLCSYDGWGLCLLSKELNEGLHRFAKVAKKPFQRQVVGRADYTAREQRGSMTAKVLEDAGAV